jgi:uncharacterized membrane protein YoaK (UPF0700 family)
VSQQTGQPPTGRGTPAARAAVRRRDALVVVLALTAGALDAVTFLRLGHVFSSVITGNLALLGLAAAQRRAAAALSAGLALAGYAAGAIAGGAIAGTRAGAQPAWPRRVTVALGGELAVLLALSGEWLATAGHPAGADRLVLLALGAGAMGIQGAAVRRLGEMSSTYMTSALTAVLTGAAVGPLPSGWRRSTGALLAIVAGAALGALAAIWAPWWVPAVILIPAVAVVAMAVRADRPAPGRRAGCRD